MQGSAGPRWREASLAAVAGAVLFALADVAGAVMRGAYPVRAADLPALFLASVGASLPVVGVASLVHACASEIALRQGRRVVLVLGAAEGLALSLVAHADVGGLTPLLAVVSSLGAALAGAAVAWAARHPRISTALAALGIATGLIVSEALGWHARAWIRLAVDLVVVACVVALIPRAIRTVSTARALGAAALAVALGAAVHPWLASSPRVRTVFRATTSHAQAFAVVLESVTDFDGDGASVVFGGRDCDEGRPDVFPGAVEIAGDGTDENCSGGDGRPPVPAPPRSSAFGAARGADVLLLSVDALRWDLAGELRETRAALGPHARFTRATSPSARTLYSLGAMIRGRPLRGVPFGPDARWTGVARGAVPTMATYLAAHGYLPRMVPAHRYLARGSGVADGFDQRLPADWPSGRGVARAPVVLGTLLAGDPSQPRPLLLWAHLLETHEPYLHDGGTGPPTIEGQRAAVRDLDPILAEHIRRLREERGRPLIVAVFGDHGEAHGEHGKRYHSSSVHAEQVRVGAFLAGPGIPSTTVDSPVSIAALPATIFELLGFEPPLTFVESSVLGCIRHESECPVLSVSELRPRGTLGYTGRRYRLIVDPTRHVEMLFDTEHDPYERHDLAAESPAALTSMRALSASWNEAH